MESSTLWPAHPDRKDSEGRWARSVHMLGLSWSFLTRTPAMRAVALAASVAWLIASLVLFGPVFVWWADTGQKWRIVVGSAVVAYPFLCVTIYFSVAMLAAANACMDGHRLTVRQSFAVATRRLPQILGWALLAAGVGALLDALAEWVPGVGALASWILGAAWSVATLFALPIIVVDGAGPREAARRSAQLFRAQWSESLIGFVSITFCLIVATIPGAMLLCLGLAAGSGPLTYAAIGLAVALFAGVSFVGVTMERLYGLVLYRYATEGETHGGFAVGDLRDGLFFKKPRWGR